jgi:hypothetical protein
MSTAQEDTRQERIERTATVMDRWLFISCILFGLSIILTGFDESWEWVMLLAIVVQVVNRLVYRFRHWV